MPCPQEIDIPINFNWFNRALAMSEMADARFRRSKNADVV
jgi:predicted aldo/keto reductase-like oxidoreductase